MKVKYFKTDDEVPKGAKYMMSVKESDENFVARWFHYFLIP